MESLRQDVVLHEVERVHEVEFPSSLEGTESSAPELLWARRSLLYRVAIRALLISTIIAFLIPRKYDSNVRIMPPDSHGDIGMILAALAGTSGFKSEPAAGLASLAGSALGTKSTGALFMELLRSRTVQDHMVDRFNLQKVYWQRYKQDARRTLDDRTDIKEDRKSGVILVTVRDSNQRRAHDMAQAYVEELDRLVAQVSTSSARRERIFIEQRSVAVKQDLEDAEHQFSEFASQNTTLDIKEQTKAMVESGAVLQGQLIVAQSELQGLEQIYTSNNVRVRSLRARVDELRRQLQNLGGTDASLTSDTTNADDLYPSIRKLPLLGVRWADLYRRMKIQETVYELLNQQYELARIEEAKEIPTVNVIDPANIPEKKSFPPRLLIIASLTALSLGATAAWIVWSTRLEQLDSRDPRRVFTLKVSETAASVLNRFPQRSTLKRLQNLLRRSRPNAY